MKISGVDHSTREDVTWRDMIEVGSSEKKQRLYSGKTGSEASHQLCRSESRRWPNGHTQVMSQDTPKISRVSIFSSQGLVEAEMCGLLGCQLRAETSNPIHGRPNWLASSPFSGCSLINLLCIFGFRQRKTPEEVDSPLKY